MYHEFIKVVDLSTKLSLRMLQPKTTLEDYYEVRDYVPIWLLIYDTYQLARSASSFWAGMSPINHFPFMKRILRCFCGTIDYKIQLMNSTPKLSIHLDVDRAGFPFIGQSTLGYYTFLEVNPISWNVKKQTSTIWSGTKKYYHSISFDTTTLI